MATAARDDDIDGVAGEGAGDAGGEDAFMAPLIKAYEDRIKELEDQNKVHAATLEELRAQAKRVSDENDAMRDQLAEALERLAKQVAESPSAGFGHGLVDGETAEELREQLESSMKEVSILRDEVETLTRLADHLNGAIQQRQQVASAAVEKLSVVEPRLKTAEGRIRTLSDRASRAETQAEQFKAEATTASDLRKAAEERLREREQAIKELREMIQQESDAVSERAKLASERARELKTKCDGIERELEATTDSNRELQRKLTSTNKDCQDMLQFMQELERQVNTYQAREKEWDASRRRAKEEVDQAMTQKAQAEAREVQTRRELARLLDKRCVEVAEAATHQQKMVEEVRSRLMAQLQARDSEINDLGKTCVHWQAQAERAARDRRSLEAELERVDEAASQEQARLHVHIDNLTQVAVTAEGDRDAAVRERDEARRIAEELHASVAIAGQAAVYSIPTM